MCAKIQISIYGDGGPWKLVLWTPLPWGGELKVNVNLLEWSFETDKRGGFVERTKSWIYESMNPDHWYADTRLLDVLGHGANEVDIINPKNVKIISNIFEVNGGERDILPIIWSGKSIPEAIVSFEWDLQRALKTDAEVIIYGEAWEPLELIIHNPNDNVYHIYSLDWK